MNNDKKIDLRTDFFQIIAKIWVALSPHINWYAIQSLVLHVLNSWCPCFHGRVTKHLWWCGCRHNAKLPRVFSGFHVVFWYEGAGLQWTKCQDDSNGWCKQKRRYIQSLLTCWTVWTLIDKADPCSLDLLWSCNTVVLVVLVFLTQIPKCCRKRMGNVRKGREMKRREGKGSERWDRIG